MSEVGSFVVVDPETISAFRIRYHIDIVSFTHPPPLNVRLGEACPFRHFTLRQVLPGFNNCCDSTREVGHTVWAVTVTVGTLHRQGKPF